MDNFLKLKSSHYLFDYENGTYTIHGTDNVCLRLGDLLEKSNGGIINIIFNNSGDVNLSNVDPVTNIIFNNSRNVIIYLDHDIKFPENYQFNNNGVVRFIYPYYDDEKEDFAVDLYSTTVPKALMRIL